MSNEEFGRPDDPVDASLRNTYRQIATERAPAHLDEAVLREAGSAVHGQRRTGFAAWRRPIAWMTMIGLTVAVVLEFSQVDPELAPPADVERPATPPAAKTETDKARRDRELDTMGAPANSRMDQAEPPAAAADAPEPAAGQPLEEAARSVEKRFRGAAAEREALSISPAADSDVPACDDDTRSDPERWRTCIERLVTEDPAAAAAEMLQYRETFPDAALPALVR